jgi:RNA polymerase-binding transcription factor DksA
MDGNLPEDAEGEDDTADLASSLMDKEMDLSVEEEIEDTMSAIEHALRKMEDGTYGICDVSNQPIPKARLELIPGPVSPPRCRRWPKVNRNCKNENPRI